MWIRAELFHIFWEFNKFYTKFLVCCFALYYWWSKFKSKLYILQKISRGFRKYSKQFTTMYLYMVFDHFRQFFSAICWKTVTVSRDRWATASLQLLFFITSTDINSLQWEFVNSILIVTKGTNSQVGLGSSSPAFSPSNQPIPLKVVK